MLAHRYDKHSKKVKFPAYIQPKLDGTRCIAYQQDGVMKAFTRNGKPYNTIPHILEELGDINPNVIWDGELYVHGENFQNLISAIKRDEPSEESKQLEFHVYDAIGFRDNVEAPFSDRMEYLNLIDGNAVKPVKTSEVLTDEDVWKAHSLFLADDYEGSIIRNKDGVYKFGKRSYDLQKVKDFDDDEFEIVGGKLDKDGCCVFRCVTGVGYEFDVRPEGTEEQRKKYFEEIDKLRGKKLSVRYFGMTTSAGSVPRFPVGISVRDYE